MVTSAGNYVSKKKLTNKEKLLAPFSLLLSLVIFSGIFGIVFGFLWSLFIFAWELGAW